MLRAFADHWRRRRIRRASRSSLTLATAATALMAMTGALLVFLARPPAPEADRLRPVSSDASPSTLDDFMPVPDATWLRRLESARIVRYELPLSALPAYGVAVVPDAARGAVTADLLIGQDGHYTLSNIVRQEPAHSLFEVPPDYTQTR
ncbi:MAG: hypothetical protein ACRD2N_21835 [Vicinamibacterales bacterium]